MYLIYSTLQAPDHLEISRISMVTVYMRDIHAGIAVTEVLDKRHVHRNAQRNGPSWVVSIVNERGCEYRSK